ncbi:hypothetical protein SDC9_139305 [bioreactor metagenome]|uniref:Uncharacterized protein n=1 Tax=bioreactor metagenome TaxID=1076179 RepID=A0A645DRR9_9ZZZZ|nr:hypothetical protein [Oscillospiraceae bacterium]
MINKLFIYILIIFIFASAISSCGYVDEKAFYQVTYDKDGSPVLDASKCNAEVNADLAMKMGSICFNKYEDFVDEVFNLNISKINLAILINSHKDIPIYLPTKIYTPAKLEGYKHWLSTFSGSGSYGYLYITDRKDAYEKTRIDVSVLSYKHTMTEKFIEYMNQDISAQGFINLCENSRKTYKESKEIENGIEWTIFEYDLGSGYSKNKYCDFQVENKRYIIKLCYMNSQENYNYLSGFYDKKLNPDFNCPHSIKVAIIDEKDDYYYKIVGTYLYVPFSLEFIKQFIPTEYKEAKYPEGKIYFDVEDKPALNTSEYDNIDTIPDNVPDTNGLINMD